MWFHIIKFKRNDMQLFNANICIMCKVMRYIFPILTLFLSPWTHILRDISISFLFFVLIWHEIEYLAKYCGEEKFYAFFFIKVTGKKKPLCSDANAFKIGLILSDVQLILLFFMRRTIVKFNCHFSMLDVLWWPSRIQNSEIKVSCQFEIWNFLFFIFWGWIQN